MNVQLFSPHKGQKAIIDGFADSEHKFGVVAPGRQFGKSLLAQNLMLYWLLQTPNQKGAWITPVYNQCKKIFNELSKELDKTIPKFLPKKDKTDQKSKEQEKIDAEIKEARLRNKRL